VVGSQEKKSERSFFLLTHFQGISIVNPMKILVCVKQVPEADSLINIDSNSGWIQTDSIDEFKMSRLDEFAVEEALLIKEAIPDTCIDVITVGPDRCEEVVRRAIGMGADGGAWIQTTSEGYSSPSRISSWIADLARKKEYTLILTGAMSEDDMQGQIGPMLAARMAMPWATCVVFEKISEDRKSIYVEREIEGGNRDTLELVLPAVITIQSGINTPRWPSLSNLLRANSLDLEKIYIGDLTESPETEQLVNVVYPQKTRVGMVLPGSKAEKAARLLTILGEKSLL
jgi:electron transfer flavoprotein beta subunit